MAVSAYRLPQAPDLASRGAGDLVRFLCDTQAELPTGDVQDGDTAITYDSKKRWRRESGSWAEKTGDSLAIWGNITGTLSNQTDLQDALDAVGGGGPHATSHQNGQADEISVEGLSGLLADAQTPAAHSHPQSEVTNLVTDLSGKAAASHSHAAGDITSGVIAMARLATGTPDGSKFIRDDGTLQAPPGGSGLPAGLIAMWHGLIANIPSGWLLCDGANGTPDLRGSFIKGAAAATEAGDTGGSLTHAHASHSYTPVGTVSQPTVTINALSGGTRKGGTSNPGSIIENNNVPTGTVSQPTFTGQEATLTHDSVNHEPPYFTVLFIMKS